MTFDGDSFVGGTSADDGGASLDVEDAATPSPDSRDAADTGVPLDADAGDDAGSEVNPPCEANDPTLRLCLRFEDDVVDESSHALVPMTNEGVQYVSGKHGKAGRFSVVPSTKVAFEDDPRLDGVRTVEAWINPAAAVSGAIVDVKDDLSMRLGAGGVLECNKPLVSTVAIPPGEWSHVACTLDGTTLRAYLNGVEVGSGASTNSVDNAAPTTIGTNSPQLDMRFEGLIDDVRLWTVTRTAEQLADSAAR